MNLHKLLFPKKYDEAISLSLTIAQLCKENTALRGDIEKLQNPENMENLMRASLGLPYIHFDNIETDAKGSDNPPHYLKGLDTKARLAYISELATIYKNEKFQAVMNYHINVLGNHSIQKATEDKMRNGRIGIIALRGFRKELEDANNEYISSLKQEENFDPYGIMPE